MIKKNSANPEGEGKPIDSKQPGGKPGQPGKPSAGGTTRAGAPGGPPEPVTVPPLFRRIDWFTFGITTLLVLIGYWITLAPDLTLEDSGELAVASMYAGVPHPPG
jgi:hypothetical protein